MTALKKQIESDIFLPKKVDQSCIALKNLIATRTHQMVTKQFGTNQALKVRLVSETRHDKPAFVTLYLKLWGKPTSLTLSAWPQSKKIQEFVTNKELLELPEELALLTLSIAFESLSQTASNIFRSNIEIIGYTLHDTIPIKNMFNSTLNFIFKIENDPEIQASLAISDDIQNKLIEVIKKIPVSSNISLQQISIPVFYEYGKTTLSKNILHSIVPGDVLIMDSHVGHKQSTLNLRLTSGQIFLAEKDENSDTYELIKEENKMPSNNYKENTSLNDIPLNLHFDIGEQALNLEEIEKIGIGYTFEIEKKLPELITLRISNKTIGYGELVTIGDRTGVRVTQLNQD